VFQQVASDRALVVVTVEEAFDRHDLWLGQGFQLRFERVALFDVHEQSIC
jgi:hypothetical protein